MGASGAKAVRFVNMTSTKHCVRNAAAGVFVRMEISDADAERAARPHGTGRKNKCTKSEHNRRQIFSVCNRIWPSLNGQQHCTPDHYWPKLHAICRINIDVLFVTLSIANAIRGSTHTAD
jgi:hypothetical protein